jgi:hypothetical protein
MTTKKRHRKSFFDLTPQRNREVARFDKEIDFSETRPLTKKQRLLHEKADARTLLHDFNFDKALLVEAMAYVKRKKLTLSQLLERGLRRELAVID